MHTTNPSDRLYNGECATLPEAFRLMIAQYRQEQQWIQQHYLPEFQEDGEQGLADLDRTIVIVQRCQHEYHDAIAAAEQALFVAWQASEQEDIARIGEAASTGNYSILAL